MLREHYAAMQLNHLPFFELVILGRGWLPGAQPHHNLLHRGLSVDVQRKKREVKGEREKKRGKRKEGKGK